MTKPTTTIAKAIKAAQVMAYMLDEENDYVDEAIRKGDVDALADHCDRVEGLRCGLAVLKEVVHGKSTSDDVEHDYARIPPLDALCELCNKPLIEQLGYVDCSDTETGEAHFLHIRCSEEIGKGLHYNPNCEGLK